MFRLKPPGLKTERELEPESVRRGKDENGRREGVEEKSGAVVKRVLGPAVLVLVLVREKREAMVITMVKREGVGNGCNVIEEQNIGYVYVYIYILLMHSSVCKETTTAPV